jgi:hypothetical protein
LTVAAACFYNAVNHTPEQPGIVITCAPVPVAQNRRYILRRENGRVVRTFQFWNISHLTNQEQFSKGSS